MKAKTIKRILAKKHDDFVKSIEDKEVRELVKKNSIITGGSIVSMLLNEPVKDYDYYFTDRETLIKAARYFIGKFKEERADQNLPAIYLNVDAEYDDELRELYGTSDLGKDAERVKIIVQSKGMVGEPEEHEVDEGEEEQLNPEEAREEINSSDAVGDLSESGNDDSESKPYRPVFLSSNAITLSNKVQIVLRFYGDADEIHENYDFEHAKCYWRSENGHLSLPRNSLEAIITKELIYTGSKYPLCSIFRAKKFINRGWHINAGQYLKMAIQLNDMNLLDVKVLEEQLTGVDAAYFHSIIEGVKSKKKNDPEFELSGEYLIEVVNKVFG